MDDLNTSAGIFNSRIKQVNNQHAVDGQCVIYVMSRVRQAHGEHALIVAQKHALALKLPFAIVFCLVSGTGLKADPGYRQTLASLKEVESELKKLNIPLIMLLGNASERIEGMIKHTNPAAIYFDLNKNPGQTALTRQIAEVARCEVLTVDNGKVVAGNTSIEPRQIIAHPHGWPGRVMTIEELSSKIEEYIVVD